MTKLAVVKANGGFVSGEMPYMRALVYAFHLKQLGNVNVKVSRVEAL